MRQGSFHFLVPHVAKRRTSNQEPAQGALPVARLAAAWGRGIPRAEARGMGGPAVEGASAVGGGATGGVEGTGDALERGGGADLRGIEAAPDREAAGDGTDHRTHPLCADRGGGGNAASLPDQAAILGLLWPRHRHALIGGLGEGPERPTGASADPAVAWPQSKPLRYSEGGLQRRRAPRGRPHEEPPAPRGLSAATRPWIETEPREK